ncbi:MAG TPA: hypothetical protein VNT32_12685 [Thermoleophilaceae bacterium]|nr:hypothetical protein [Thermoleophilaceae bacterium]
MAKEKPKKMQMRLGSLQAIPQLESRSDEELLREQKHRAAARAILGARAAERYDAKAARAFFNEAMVGTHPQERHALRQMMRASLALAERRPDELKEAVQKLGHAPPSSRQLLALRFMGLLAPPPGASPLVRARGILLIIAMIVLLLLIGFGLAKLIALPFGGAGTIVSILLGLVVIIAILGVLTVVGRRRQARAQAAARGPQ